MDDEQKLRLQFDKQKQATLNKKDKSNKGSIDEPIQQLVELLNSHPLCYTTSTCSGRITVISKPHGFAGLKKDSDILLNLHTEIDSQQLNQVIQKHESSKQSKTIKASPPTSPGTNSTNVFYPGLAQQLCLWLKYEPFILHVQTFNIRVARDLLKIALSCGCRNSGLTFSSGHKFLVAIRSCSTMEVPIYLDNKFKIDDEQCKFLCGECNTRMIENSRRLLKFESQIESNFAPIKPKIQSQISSTVSESNPN